MTQPKIIHVKFKDSESAEIFVKVLNKAKEEKSESLTNLDKAQFFDVCEKKLDSIEEIN